MVAARKGYRLTVVIPDNASEERIGLLRLFGAEIVFSDGDKGTNGSIEVARALAAGRQVLHAVPVREPGEPARAPGGHRRRRSSATSRRSRTSWPGWARAARSPGTAAGCTPTTPTIKVIAAEPELGDLVYGLRSLDDGLRPADLRPERGRTGSSSWTRRTRSARPASSPRGRASSRASRAAPSSTSRSGSRSEIDEGDIVCLLRRRRLEVPVDRGLGRGPRHAPRRASPESLWW